MGNLPHKISAHEEGNALDSRMYSSWEQSLHQTAPRAPHATPAVLPARTVPPCVQARHGAHLLDLEGRERVGALRQLLRCKGGGLLHLPITAGHLLVRAQQPAGLLLRQALHRVLELRSRHPTQQRSRE